MSKIMNPTKIEKKANIEEEQNDQNFGREKKTHNESNTYRWN